MGGLHCTSMLNLSSKKNSATALAKQLSLRDMLYLIPTLLSNC